MSSRAIPKETPSLERQEPHDLWVQLDESSKVVQYGEQGQFWSSLYPPLYCTQSPELLRRTMLQFLARQPATCLLCSLTAG